MKYRINLLPQKEKKPVEKVIYFALHYLRYILVLTQIVVIGVFFYRFKIDQEIIDLKDELKQKQEIVQVSDPLLKEAKAADIKTREIKAILTEQEQNKKMFQYFLSIFPQELFLEHLEIKKNSMEFTTTSANPDIVKVFYQKLKKDNMFKKIELGSIRRSENGFYCPFKLLDYK